MQVRINHSAAFQNAIGIVKPDALLRPTSGSERTPQGSGVQLNTDQKIDKLVARLVDGDHKAELSDALSSYEKNYLQELFEDTYTKEGSMAIGKNGANLTSIVITKRVDVKA